MPITQCLITLDYIDKNPSKMKNERQDVSYIIASHKGEVTLIYYVIMFSAQGRQTNIFLKTHLVFLLKWLHLHSHCNHTLNFSTQNP